jgi:hypothetical protein
MKFAIKAEVRSPRAATFAFDAQKTMYREDMLRKATGSSSSRARTKEGRASSRAAW